jgi:hypothetical protein
MKNINTNINWNDFDNEEIEKSEKKEIVKKMEIDVEEEFQNRLRQTILDYLFQNLYTERKRYKKYI